MNPSELSKDIEDETHKEKPRASSAEAMPVGNPARKAHKNRCRVGRYAEKKTVCEMGQHKLGMTSIQKTE